MNVFWREMKAQRKALIIWCIGILALVVSGMKKYSVYSASGQSTNEVFAKLPKSLQVLLGTDSFDLSKVDGYYGMLFIYLVLMTTIHASLLGSTIIAKEERDKTVEFLIAKPISRSTILTAKLSSALVNIAVLNIVTLISSIMLVSYYGKGQANLGGIILLMTGMFIMQLIFMLIGAATASVSKSPKSAPSKAAVVLFAAYILSMLIDMNNRLDIFKYITPFKYYEAKNLLTGKGFEPIFVILSVGIITAMLAATYRLYQRREFK